MKQIKLDIPTKWSDLRYYYKKHCSKRWKKNDHELSVFSYYIETILRRNSNRTLSEFCKDPRGLKALINQFNEVRKKMK